MHLPQITEAPGYRLERRAWPQAETLCLQHFVIVYQHSEISKKEIHKHI